MQCCMLACFGWRVRAGGGLRNLPKAAILPQPARVHLACCFLHLILPSPISPLCSYYTMPDISYEALAGAALVIVLAVGYQYIPKADADAAGPGASGKSKKKNKKKVKGSKLEEVESGSASETSKKMEEAKTKAKKGKGERSNTSIPPAPAPIAAEPEAPSSAEVTSDGTEQTKEEKAKPKTLAQKIAPKNRKSKVDE